MPINDWWAGEASERFWMETTGRHDLGVDLHAPQLNGAGKPEWGYSLVAETQPGDVVLHWHKSLIGRPALVGWSTVVGPLSVDEHYSWMPQGSRGRSRGVPTVGRGWRVPCEGFQEFMTPVDRSVLASRETAMQAVRDDLRARVSGATYFPFSFYRPGEVRSSQSYLTKFPRALLDVLPELAQAAHVAESSPPVFPIRPVQPGTGRSGRFQDVRRRLCVEQHAVSRAKDYYVGLGASEVEELGKPFDLLVRGVGAVRHVEVKGSTSTTVAVVELTINEVAHAANHQPTDLVVVDGIALDVDGAGAPSASGGEDVPSSVELRWRPDDHQAALTVSS